MATMITVGHTCTHCGKGFKRRIRAGSRAGRYISCPHCKQWQAGPTALAEIKATDSDEKKKRATRAAAPATRSKSKRKPAAAGGKPPPTKIEERPEKAEEDQRLKEEEQERHPSLVW